MTERTRVWRWSDLLLVVGIVVLLLPIVVADEDSQDVPTRFTTAETRVGDRAEYALFMGSHNESLVRTTPFLTLEVRSATPDEEAFGAEYTVEAMFSRMSARTAWLTASSWDLSVRHLFTAEGAWLATRYVGSLPVVHPVHQDALDTYDVDVFIGHRSDLWNFAAEFALRANVHRPTGVGADLAGAVRSLLGDQWQHRAPYWSVDGVPLFATNHGAHMGPTDTLIHRTFGLDRPEHACQLFGLKPHVVRHGLSLEHRIPADECGWIQGTWFTPLTSLPAGNNWFLRDDAERWWSMDLHMVSFSRGEGPPLPQLPALVHASVEGGPAIDSENVGIDQIDADSTPLFRGVTLPKVRATLEEGAEGTPLAQSFASEARLVGYGWRETGSEPRAANASALAGIVNESAARLHTVHHDWELWFLTADNDLIQATFGVRESLPEGTLEFDGFHYCHGQTFDCMISSSVDFKISEQRLDPKTFLARGTNVSGGLLDSFWSFPAIEQPYEHPRFAYNGTTPVRPLTKAFTPAASTELGVVAFYSDGLRGHMGWAAPQADTESAPSARSYYDVHDGFVHSETVRIVPQTDEDDLRPLDQAAAQLQIQSEHGAALRAAGFLMAIAAALWRVSSTLAAGAHFPGVAWLYAKIRNADLLLHERRAAIMHVVDAERGVTATEVAQRLGYGWGSTVHHLQRLVHAGLLRTSIEGTQRYYVLADQQAAVGRGTVSRQRLLAAIEANPGATAAELAEEVKRRRASVTRLAARLVDAELVTRKRDGRKVRFYPTPSGNSTKPEQSF